MKKFSFVACLWLAIPIFISFIVVSPLGADIAVFFIVTIFGVGFAAFMEIIPALTIAAVSFCIGMSLATSFVGRLTGIVTGLTLAAMALFLPPILANSDLERQARAYLAADIKPAHIAPPRTLALTGTHTCDWLCVRLLLNGQVERVLMIDAPLWEAAKNGRKRIAANLFWLERSDDCGVQPLKLLESGDQGKFGEKMNVDTRELLLLKLVREKLCLRARPARDSEADGIVYSRKIHSGKSEIEAGMALFTDTINAWRLSYFVKTRKGWKETYGVTRIKMLKVFPIYMPGLVESRYNLHLVPGLQRYSAKTGAKDISRERFLRDVMGLKLRVDGKQADTGRR